jgi:hypothetical protein
LSRSSTIEIIPAAADWNRLAASTPVKDSAIVLRPVTLPTVDCSSPPRPVPEQLGDVALADGQQRADLGHGPAGQS